MLILKFKEGTKREDYINKLKYESSDLVSDIRDETVVIDTTVHMVLHNNNYITIYDRINPIITFDKVSIYFDIGMDKPVSIGAVFKSLMQPKRTTTIGIDEVNQYAAVKKILSSSVNAMISNLCSDIRVIKSDSTEDLFTVVEECLSALNLSYAEIATFVKFIMCRSLCRSRMLDSDIMNLILNLYMIDIAVIYRKLSERFN